MSGADRSVAAPRVVLVGLDTLQGLQAARILASRGVTVIGIADDPDHYACHTRVCERIIIGATNGTAAVRLLAEMGRELGTGTILLPCHDHAVLTLSRNREALAESYRFALPAPDIVEALMDKARFYEIAAAQGMRVPATQLLHSPEDAARVAATLRFPVILKPPIRTLKWNAQTSLKVYHARDATEFLDCYRRISAWVPVLLVQEWIAGTDADVYVFSGYFDQHGVPVATIVARKLRQWPPLAGTGCLRETVHNDDVLHASLRLLQAVGFHGLGHIEIKRDARTGEYVAIETNLGRPVGLCAVVEASGVEMLYANYCDLAGLPLPSGLHENRAGTKCLDLRHDLQSAWWYWRRGELTVGDWWDSLRGVRAHGVWSWSDPAPMVWDLWRAARKAAVQRQAR